MFGACICKCPNEPKLLVSCSGVPTPGFKEAVNSTPFMLVESFQMSERQMKAVAEMDRKAWDCSAPKLLQAGGAGGHKVRTMSERWFSPLNKSTSAITYSHTDDTGTRQENRKFGHGESVPSCEACQKLTPEMLCNNKKECA
jgi:hypothetical protein